MDRNCGRELRVDSCDLMGTDLLLIQLLLGQSIG